MLDILIKNGRVIDPARGVDEARDVGILEGMITEPGDAREVVDASGCIVTPGLIDAHLHIRPLLHAGVQPESACFPSGVTACADGGSAGWQTYEDHRPGLVGTRMRIKCFLNVSAVGLAGLGSYDENIDPALWKEERILALLRRYPGELCGLKLRLGKETVRDLGAAPLYAAVKLARRTGVPLMIHPTNTPIPLRQILDALGPGDILTHAFQGHGETILGEGGLEAARRAQARGVLMDVGDAAWHFSNRVFLAAREAGIRADTLSTDLTANGLYLRGLPKAFSMAWCMARQLALGVPVEEIVRMTTANPARMLGLDAGSLETGARADAAVLRMVKKELSLVDGMGEAVAGRAYLRPMLTVCRGNIVYRDMEI